MNNTGFYKLHKKLQRIERKYERLPAGAKVQRLRLLKSYQATLKKIKHRTGGEVFYL
jgi:hypothetical protein